MTLSVIVLTLNEGKHIRACLESVRPFGDELLVFDSGSTDETAAIARAEGARVETRAFDNYANQRNAALEAARGEWVFFLDADERAGDLVGREICGEIARIKSTAAATTLFWIPRRNVIFGKELRHTGWSPDFQPRVLKKGLAWFDTARPVHELVVTSGESLYLEQPLVHFNYETLAQFRTKQERYTRFEAQMMVEQGIQPRLRSLVSMPAREFLRRFVTLEGYRDGAVGLALSGLMAYYAFWRQVWARQMWRERQAGSRS